MDTLRELALTAIRTADPSGKVAMAHGLRAAADAGRPIGEAAILAEPADLPGRPARPLLVPHIRIRQRSVHTAEGRAGLLHALAHIEFNAIDLALDVVWRYPGLPPAFYADWIRVADEEALHFSLLREHLQALDHDYGDFPAHRGLWDMAERTRGDLLARLALVPRTLEARGLDASPPVRRKLVDAGDLRGGEILDLILRDEIGHVAIGNRWYRWLCALRGLDPLGTYPALAAQYGAPRPRAPFNVEARRAAGFTEPELAALAEPAGTGRRNDQTQRQH